MVVPALIMGGAAIGSSLLAANATGNASDAASAQNQANFDAQQRENMLQRIMAERLLQIQLSDSQDAFGNKSQYIPGIGFVTTPDPKVKTLQDASIREQTQQLTQDASRQREGRQRTAERGRDEGATADSLLQEFQRLQQSPQSAQELFQLLLGSGQQAFQRNQDDQLQQVLRQHLRSGSGDGNKAVAAFAKEGSGQRRDAAVDARLRSIQGADQINQGRLNNTSNLFNQFAQRAQNSFGNVAFAPEQISGQANQLGLTGRQAALGGSQIAGQLTSGIRPPLGQVLAPDLSGSQAFNEVGVSLAEILRTLNAQPNASSDTSRGLGNSSTQRHLQRGFG